MNEYSQEEKPVCIVLLYVSLKLWLQFWICILFSISLLTDHNFLVLMQATSNEAPDTNVLRNEFDFLDSVS